MKVSTLNKQKFFNKNGEVSIKEFNCGGLALRTFDWYLPYNGSDEAHDMEVLQLFKSLPIEDAKNTLLEKESSFIVSDLGLKEVELSEVKSLLQEEKEVTLFRLGFYEDEYIEDCVKASICIDYDFHFVRLTGITEEGLVHYLNKDGYDKIKEGVDSLDDLLFAAWQRFFWAYEHTVRAFVSNFDSE